MPGPAGKLRGSQTWPANTTLRYLAADYATRTPPGGWDGPGSSGATPTANHHPDVSVTEVGWDPNGAKEPLGRANSITPSWPREHPIASRPRHPSCVGRPLAVHSLSGFGLASLGTSVGFVRGRGLLLRSSWASPAEGGL